MSIKSLLGMVCAGILSMGLMTNKASAEVVTLTDYLVLASPGDSWTYTTSTLTDGMPAGTDFTVTEPWYNTMVTLFPETAPRGRLIEIETCNSIYLDLVDSLTVAVGTFKNVLRMSWLDCNFTANAMNAVLGIDPAIDKGVTDVDWLATGVGPVKYMGVMAENGLIDGGYDLKSYSVDYSVSGWTATDFHTLCATPAGCTPTKAIEFDALGNLYVEDTTDNETLQVEIIKLDATSGYSVSSLFASYSTTYKGVNGLDFDGLGNLYVSEGSTDGDAGVIRKIDVATQSLLGDVMTFANHRPTGVDADIAGSVFYSGRKESDGTWGKIFEIDTSLVRTELNASIVATGIALDTYGNIFISTPNRTDLPLLSNSIYMFRSTDVGLLNPILIGTFKQRGGELTFDDAGDLYMIAEDQLTIIKVSAADTDGDGVRDYMDNCTLTGNPLQRDTDIDGFGNFCDPDFDNNLVVGAADLAFFKPKFFGSDPDADLNGDGVVSGGDLAILKQMFFKPPGPGGLVP